jgi:hypothetical protein
MKITATVSSTEVHCCLSSEACPKRNQRVLRPSAPRSTGYRLTVSSLPAFLAPLLTRSLVP